MTSILIMGPIFFLIASFTGGVAGAYVARGSESRSLLENAAIGLFGWIPAIIVWSLLFPRGEGGLILVVLAFVFSVGVVKLDERRQRKQGPSQLHHNGNNHGLT